MMAEQSIGSLLTVYMTTTSCKFVEAILLHVVSEATEPCIGGFGVQISPVFLEGDGSGAHTMWQRGNLWLR